MNVYLIALLWGLMSIVISIVALSVTNTAEEKVMTYRNQWYYKEAFEKQKLEEERLRTAGLAYAQEAAKPTSIPIPDFLVELKEFAYNELSNMTKQELEVLTHFNINMNRVHPQPTQDLKILLLGKSFTIDQYHSILTYLKPFTESPITKRLTPIEDSHDQPRLE